MFNGFARVIQGAFDKNQPTWFRTFSIGIGALSIGTSIFVTNSKMFGILFPIRTLFMVLVIYGIGMIVYGITGKLSIDQILKKRVIRPCMLCTHSMLILVNMKGLMNGV
jgi:hypothetical protein